MGRENFSSGLRQASDWIDEKVFNIDRDRARIPQRIMQEALREVGYENSAAHFEIERLSKGCVAIPFTLQLTYLTFDKVSRSLEKHKGEVDPKIWGEDGRIFKSIVHNFCHNSTVSNLPERSEQYNFLVNSVVILSALSNGVMGDQPVRFSDDKKIAGTIDLMVQKGLLKRKPGKKMEHIYPTQLLDPLLV